MRAQQQRCSGKSTTAGQDQHPQYTHADRAQVEFQQWCLDHDVRVPALVPDEWVRTNCPGKKASNKSLAVLRKPDCILAFNHIMGDTHPFPSSRSVGKELWQSQRAEFERQRAAEAERKAIREKRAADEAFKVFGEGVSLNPFGYMSDKGLSSTHGARWHPKRKCWLVPIYDIMGRLVNVQRVYNQKPPNKYFWPGARITGCMMILGTIDANTKRVLIAEGFATCGTLRQETGLAVIGSINAGNLLPVCELVSAMYPDTDIVVCGDDDRFTDGNPGRAKAEAAAAAVGARVAFPAIDDACTRCTDFNDAVTCSVCSEVAR